jgi:hypothetical protein
MVVAFASPLIQFSSGAVQAVSKNSKPISNVVLSLFRNKGVQAGVGLAATAGGVYVLGGSAKEAAKPFGELSPIIVIVIIFAVIILLMRGKN